VRRLFRGERPPPDARPALLAVASLMLVIVPMILLTSSGQKLTGIGLALAGPEEELPPLPPGPVESLRVEVEPQGYRVRAGVRRSDVRAQIGEVEQQELLAPDLPALQAHLGRLKALDPARRRVQLAPHAETDAAALVALVDALRQGPDGPLFPEVVLEPAP